MLYGQIKQSVIHEELVFVVDLGRNEITLPVLVNVFPNGILQGGDQIDIVTLDGNHELVGGTEPLIRLFKGLDARGALGQQVRKVRIKLEAGLKENRNRA